MMIGMLSLNGVLREWSPSPPKERLSWACCQAASVTSAARQAEKQDLVSPSKARRASEGRLERVVLKMWGSVQKPPQIRSNEIANMEVRVSHH